MLESWTIQKILTIDELHPDFDVWTFKQRKRFKNHWQLIKALQNMLSDEGTLRDVLNLHYMKWYELCSCGCTPIRRFVWNPAIGNPYRRN